ncbi:MAG: YegS/Rv2252/BmrU family lipid kinase [Candidatus Baltobacteraceae bacterium]
MKATVILNVHSSRTRRELARIPALLAAKGIEIARFRQVAGNADLKRRLKEACKRGDQLLVVGGGDGTMTQTANVLAHTDTALGVLPLGTGNSFALTLGIGEDLERAVDVIAGGRVARVDLGVANGRYFANFATIGFAAEVAESTARGLKKLVGPLAYLAAAVPALLTHRGFHARVRAKRHRLQLDAQQIIVVNGRFFGNRAISAAATNTDGKLAFFTTAGVSRTEIVKTYLALGLGLHERLPEAHEFASKRFKIRTKPKQPLNLDGDAFGTTPVRFAVARRALRVFVPRDFVDEQT